MGGWSWVRQMRSGLGEWYVQVWIGDLGRGGRFPKLALAWVAAPGKLQRHDENTQ